jgi:PAS domain S-box-containing protein
MVTTRDREQTRLLNAKSIFGYTPSILLVEDNNDMREYVCRLLQEDGYDVHVAEDGQAALELTARHSYDLILSDVMMPNVDGIQLLQAIRKDSHLKTTPVILLSARAGEEFRIQGLGAGADDYLTKPFSARELLSHVSAHIDSHLRQRESEERLNLALELGNMGTWDIDLRANAMFWSPGEYKLFGYSAEGCAPSWEAWTARIHPEDLPNVLKQWEAVKNNRTDLRMEYRVNLPDGTTHWIDGRARFFYDEGGTAYRAIGASKDITDRKHTEEELRTGSDRLLQEVKGQEVALRRSSQQVAAQAELLDLSHDAPFISDLENKITY